MGYAGSAISCIGVFAPTSVFSLTSAFTIGPQTAPAAKDAHSTLVPDIAGVFGKGNVKAEANIRSPVEPVSTKMFGIVWQDEVPGMQTVTDVYAIFTLL